MHGYVAAKGSNPVTVPKPDFYDNKNKRNIDQLEIMDAVPTKKFKHNNCHSDDQGPSGFIWDETDYSCAYDSLFTILLSIWNRDPIVWKTHFCNINRTLNLLASGFHKHSTGEISLEMARDKVRCILQQRDPVLFPTGTAGVNIHDLIDHMFMMSQPLTSLYIRCLTCNHILNLNNERVTGLFQCPNEFVGSTADFFRHSIAHGISRKCEKCDGMMEKVTHFHKSPTILLCALNNAELTLSRRLTLNVGHRQKTYYLRGIIYFGNFHFTSRIVMGNGNVWFHDGIATGGRTQRHGRLAYLSDLDLMICDGKKAAILVYSVK